MEKRLLLAAALSIVVLLVWDAISPKPPKPAPVSQTPAAAMVPPPASVSSSPAPLAPGAPPPPAPPAVDVVPVAAASETTVTIERPLYRAVIDNRGGVLTSFVLKRYDDDSGHPLDMVHRGDAPERPLSLDFGADADATRAANASLYEMTRSDEKGADVVRLRYGGEGRS